MGIRSKREPTATAVYTCHRTEQDILLYGLLRSDHPPEQNQGIRKLTRLVNPLARKMVIRNNGSLADIPDLVQEVVVSIWENVRKGSYTPQPSKPLEAYARMIIRYQWLKVLRLRVMLKEEPLSIGEFADETPPDETDRDRVLHALNQLGDLCQQILKWYYLDKLSLGEIAQKLGKTYTATKEQKYRCLIALKERLRT